jgi:hypothetical protein
MLGLIWPEYTFFLLEYGGEPQNRIEKLHGMMLSRISYLALRHPKGM